MSDWLEIEIAGKPARLFEPPAARFTLLWLGAHSALPHLIDPCAQFNLRCLAPWGEVSWWVDRPCSSFDEELTGERHLLHNVVPWIEGHYPGGHRSIALCGTEIGGQAALRMALKHPLLFRAAASLDGVLDFHELHGRGTALDGMYESKERCRQDTAILRMHPSEWPPHLGFACDPSSPWFRGNDRLHEKLRAHGVPHLAELEAGGNLHAMLQFLASGLEKESRRLM